MIGFSVVGASGYVGGELLRLAVGHPELKLLQAAAYSNAGESVISVHPHLNNLRDAKFDSIDINNLLKADVVFLALPHGRSAEIASQLSDSQLVIDAGADFRLQSARDWTAFYDTPHAGQWPYGLPELVLSDAGKQRAKLFGVKRIAAPGCNVSAVTLGLAPGYAAGLFESVSSSTLAVGTSGAGRSLKANLLASEVMGSASAYGVAGSHRHNPEILQNLRASGAVDPIAHFTPILVPMSRGILSVTHVQLKSNVSENELRACYQDAYASEPFVQLLPPGTQPSTGAVFGSNFVQISTELDRATRTVTITVAIDNLVKGTAGAAIQSMNIALGLQETTGLTALGVAP